MDRIQKSFDNIKADTELKENTKAYLSGVINKKPRTVMRFTPVIAVFLIVLLFGSYSLYYTPFAYIDMDINPSIELTINRFDKVINVYSYNKEGSELLDKGLINMDYEKAVDTLFYKMEDSGYFSNTGLLSVTIQSGDNNKESVLVLNVKKKIDHKISGHHNTEVQVFSVSQEIKKQSHSLHFTPAKYLAAIKLQEANPDIHIEDCQEHSISEINQLTDSYSKKQHGHELGNQVQKDGHDH